MPPAEAMPIPVALVTAAANPDSDRRMQPGASGCSGDGLTAPDGPSLSFPYLQLDVTLGLLSTHGGAAAALRCT